MSTHPRQRRSLLCIVACIVAASALTGCSTYEHDWEAAAALDEPKHAMQGRWRGGWHSSESGHEGDLRAIITKVATGNYHARFHATWGILDGEFETELTGEMRDNVFHFSGEKDLGWLYGGLFRTEGLADGEQFKATYRAKDDEGTFEMTRVQ
jgi:hypothetical protein